MWEKLKTKIKKQINMKKEPRNINKILLSRNLNKNVKEIKSKFNNVEDLIFRDIKLDDKTKGILIYIKSISEKELINKHVLMPLNENDFKKNKVEDIISIDDIDTTNMLDEIIDEILVGKSVLLLENKNEAYILNTQGWEERAVPEPSVERTIRGPNESFMENIEVNIGLIRRRIKHNDFKLENYTKGTYTQTQISICYIEGIVDEQIVKEVKRRLELIETDEVYGCTYIAELIEDNPVSFFSTTFNTQRPDVAVAALLEGRVAILADNCPSAILVPKLFMENLISPDDYYNNYWYVLFVRQLRFFAYLISTMLPAFYVAAIAFHQTIIPEVLASRIYSSREGIPFPIFVEMIIFGAFFEIIKEAGARIPNPIGASITIVGTLILGDVAVTAGFLSADVVIIGSLTALSVFLIPVIEFSNSLLIVRIAYLLAANFFGIYGITIISLIMIMHLTSLNSFGVIFTKPLAPIQLADFKDLFIRFPYFLNKDRPKSLKTKRKRRFFMNYKFKK